MGPVTIGRDAYVGEMTVLDIDTSLGDGAQLGHSSSLSAGQSIPDGEHRHGSPAREKTEVNYGEFDPVNYGFLRKMVFSAVQNRIGLGGENDFESKLRKIVYSAVQLLSLFIFSSISFSIFVTLIPLIAELPYFAGPESPLLQWPFYRDVLAVSVALFFGSTFFGLVIMFTVPRVFNLAIKSDKIQPLYGFHYWAHQNIARITNVKFFTYLFGDSSYIVHYLRWLGYNFSEPIVQTGSNFGLEVKHENPFLVSIGSGTMIADGLSIINTSYSSTSFQVSRVAIGSDNFLGNNIAYHSQGKTGDNCLLATKVMVPSDGDIRESVGLLGSPSFEIPRTVRRDSELAESQSDDELADQLAAKNKHNLVTMGLFLLMRWFAFSAYLLVACSVLNLYPTVGSIGLALAVLFMIMFTISYHIFIERAAALFKTLQPQQVSIYDPYFWFHERYWKLGIMPSQMAILDGTPMKNLAWRLLGIQIGKRVFDDGCFISEKTMVTIGDDCTLNAKSTLQCHSQEDGGFKSDNITIGAGCTVGVRTFIHYGTTIGDGVVIDSNAFLMKGEEVPSHTQWGDNPAMEVQDQYNFPVEAAVNR